MCVRDYARILYRSKAREQLRGVAHAIYPCGNVCGDVVRCLYFWLCWKEEWGKTAGEVSNIR